MTLSMSMSLPERGVQLDVEVGDGEVVALLGPNGAGKSTVLSVAAGLLRPRRGRVELSGRVLTEVSPERVRTWVAPHARRIALLAQEPLLFPHLSVQDNVGFGPRSAGAGRAASRAVAHEWLAQVDASDLADRRPAELSGGQAQRVAIARALAARPDVLLLDEPMAALDVAVAPALRQMLKRVLAGQSALIVTHDVLDALLLADRVVVIDGGRVVEEGPSRHVLAQPRSSFAARIAGLNMVSGPWREGAVQSDAGLRVEGLSVGPAPVGGSEAAAVFRPNAVSVFRERPGSGSPRNALAVRITDLEPRGDLIRVHGHDLMADVTPHAVAELDLAPGDQVMFVVKATDVSVYAT
ncbi:MAG: ATP-binding cassette domain-containing protein [Nocardioides sp.]